MTWARARAFAFLVSAAVAGSASPADSCDVCAVYTAMNLGPSRAGFRVGLAEQYTYFGTVMDDSVEVENPGEQMRSSITQVLLGYNVGPNYGVQVNLPIIHRLYTRLEGGRLVDGSESGIGDMSLLGSFTPFISVGERGLTRLTLFGGVKFPTGNSDPLAEEADEAGLDERLRDDFGVGSISGLGSVAHDESESAIHGHDLALGSGSYDGIVGAQIFLSLDRFFWTTAVQYAIRTEGSFDYRYANDLVFNGGPGYFLYLDHGWMVGAQGFVSGETKGQDQFQGQALSDTAITYLFAGPAVRVAYGASLLWEVAGDIPFVRHETSLQIVPDYRVRAGLVWRF